MLYRIHYTDIIIKVYQIRLDMTETVTDLREKVL